LCENTKKGEKLMKNILKLTSLLLLSGLIACGTDNSSSSTSSSPDYTVDKARAIEVLTAIKTMEENETLPEYSAFKVKAEMSSSEGSESSHMEQIVALDTVSKEYYSKNSSESTTGSGSQSAVGEAWVYVDSGNTYTVRNDYGNKYHTVTTGEDAYNSVESSQINTPASALSSFPWNTSFTLSLLNNGTDSTGYTATSETFESTGASNLSLSFVLNVSEEVTGIAGGVTGMILDINYDNYRVSEIHALYSMSDSTEDMKLTLDYVSAGIVLPDLSEYPLDSSSATK
jgi:hypothetical protein